MDETLIETFKEYYNDYRSAAEPEESFEAAFDALTYTVIDVAEQLADDGDLEGIRDIFRQYREIRNTAQGSNDSVQERFEEEYRQGTDRQLV